ncbi:hypothetical protein GCM10022423_00930 [Flavobacterium ginsengiterrae]|uniref:Uncharacterized protein n=1 Tax=Flavobacterium ginsengiterrae TaxID=871695 RepID=A0ABP7G4G8_9FLAO
MRVRYSDLAHKHAKTISPAAGRFNFSVSMIFFMTSRVLSYALCSNALMDRFELKEKDQP